MVIIVILLLFLNIIISYIGKNKAIRISSGRSRIYIILGYCLEIVLEKLESFCVTLWELLFLSYGRIYNRALSLGHLGKG